MRPTSLALRRRARQMSLPRADCEQGTIVVGVLFVFFLSNRSCSLLSQRIIVLSRCQSKQRCVECERARSPVARRFRACASQVTVAIRIVLFASMYFF